jgi:hypothetical protein
LILQALGIQYLFILDVLGIFWAVFTVSGEFLEPVANFWEFLVEVFPIFSRFGSLFLVPPTAASSDAIWSATRAVVGGSSLHGAGCRAHLSKGGSGVFCSRRWGAWSPSMPTTT